VLQGATFGRRQAVLDEEMTMFDEIRHFLLQSLSTADIPAIKTSLEMDVLRCRSNSVVCKEIWTG
jgi:hypothetical protein